MRKPLFVITAALLSIFAGQLHAAELKIGVVNPARLIAESPQAQAIRERLEQEFAGKRRELMAQQNEIKTLQEKYQRDAQVMSESERTSMQRRVRELERDLQFGAQTLNEDVQRRQNEELGKLQRELGQAINAFATENGYDLILSEGVAYRSDAVDVTEQILARIIKK